MSEINVRELRNHGGEVLERVVRGETLTVTRAGVPVAELRPVRRAPIRAGTLLERWRALPHTSPNHLREELDALINPGL